jgi:hypothetical protein
MSSCIIQIALAAAISTAAAGQLPRLISFAQLAKLQILKDTESSRWCRPFLFPRPGTAPMRVSKSRPRRHS